MKLGDTIILPEDNCPVCGHKVNASCASDADGPDLSPGDFSLCLHCGGMGVLDENFRLRPPTADELDEASRHEDFNFKRKAAEAFLRDRRQLFRTEALTSHAFRHML